MANLWASAQDQPYDLLIRVQHNDRKLANSELKLSAFINNLSLAGSYQLAISKLYRKNNNRKIGNRSQRAAKMEVRFSAVQLHFDTERAEVDLPLYVVDARERADSLAEGEEPIHWILLSTRKVESFEEAMEMIQFYEWRWQTEELYRTSKKKGFAIEESELQSLDAIFKQTILSLEAAFRVMRLVMSRDKDSGHAIKDVFSSDQIKCLAILNNKLEGKTQKLSNPWPKDQLAWAAWIIARLSGWKGYQSRTPPGPIRMKRGLDKFYIYFDAWKLFDDEVDVGDS